MLRQYRLDMGSHFLMNKLRKSARGQDCQIRIPGVCNHNPETVILAHLNGAGMGTKHADIHGSYACSRCHAVVDGEKHRNYSPDILKLYHLEGVIRTQKIMLDQGLINI